MLSIGEFARHLGVSVRMLRHYDALGLLIPAHVDPSTGYRHYTAAQLDRGNRLHIVSAHADMIRTLGDIDSRIRE